MSFEFVDEKIRAWSNKRDLRVVDSFESREVRAFYVSSKSGECFQIWVEPPTSEGLNVFLACIEGRRENEPPLDWRTPPRDIVSALEEAYQTLVLWMKPSERN